MAKEETVEKLKNPMTLRAFIIGLVLSIVVSFISIYGQGIYAETRAPVLGGGAITLIIMVILSLLITPWLKSMAFSAGELVIVYVMTLSNAFSDHLAWGTLHFPLAAMASTTVGAAAQQWMPEIWFPRDPSIWQPMLTGGAAVPWGVWIIPMLYWITLQLCWFGIGIAFGFILRRSLIEVERVPFPYTQVIAPLTSEVKKPVRERVNVPLLLVGFVIGFIVQGTYSFFPRVIPGFPDFYPRTMWGMKGYDFGPIVGADIYRNQMLVVFFDNAISLFGLLFLLPTKILGSALLVHFIWGNILPYVEVSMGMVTNLGNFGVYDIIGWAVNMVGTMFEPTGIAWYTIFNIGFPIGFIFTYLFFVRREISASLKDALRGTRSEVIAWTLFVVSIVGYLVLDIGTGVTLVTSFAFLVLSFVYLIQTIRMRGETIMDVNPVFNTWLQIPWETSGGEAARNTPELFRDGLMGGLTQSQAWMHSGKMPAWVPFEGMRLLEMSGEKWDWKPLGLAVAVSLVINLFIGWTVNLWGTYTNGVLVNWMTKTYAEHTVVDVEQNFSPMLLTPGSYATGVVPLRPLETFGGIALGIAVTALNSMFAWWPIHPLGFLIGTVFGFGVWNWALTAFIVRLIVLRVGGSKLYNKAVQVVLGSLIGSALISILEFAAVLAGY